MPLELLIPEWPAPPTVKALQTTRRGGVSTGAWDSLNLGEHVGDDEAHVAANRQYLASQLPAPPAWLQQVHGTDVLRLPATSGPHMADAACTRRPHQVCVVMTADCLPLLLCDRAGTVVAAVHAGWRGLCDGVIEAAVAAMAVSGEDLLAWLGPAIGPQAFEVGPEVRQAFVSRDAGAASAFMPGRSDRWWADIYLLARQRLERLGVSGIHGGDRCTYTEAEYFFSYRRDGVTGRMGTF
ncbi:MAG TPA: peptidoglycan editing factor PgeF, partial [Rhodocyclaceae bacterium]|nr:peptidoglycan editing factor PgeF [Rhodocyclaceae bacterium]